MKIVPGYGPTPCDWMIVGEAPGRDEAKIGRPFVGRSGQEQQSYLRRCGLEQRNFYRTNVVKEYKEGNPDPTPTQIREWTPLLLEEVEDCNPLLIIAVGRFAIQWFLGDDARLDIVHGIPHRAGAFDESRSNRAPSQCVIVPVHHPALGFYDKNAKSVIWWDFQQAANCVKRIQNGEGVQFSEDEFEGREEYLDVSGEWLQDWIASNEPAILGLDTEGYEDDPWSIQVSALPGEGYVLRVDREDFQVGINALQSTIDNGTEIVIHYAMHDIPVCRAMGLELRRAIVWDTMYSAYILRTEPRGLKALCWRWNGMRHQEFGELVAGSAKEEQIDYLVRVIDSKVPGPEPRVIIENDGTSRLYKPQSAVQAADRILLDVMVDKRDKDDNPVDIQSRWSNVLREQRELVEEEVGKFPIPTLKRIPIEDATRYSCRDSDAALRLQFRLNVELEDRGLLELRERGRKVLPMFEEMQSHGMPVSRVKLEELLSEVDDKCFRLVRKLAKQYNDGEPFNPNSSPQTRKLLDRLGLKPTKLTKKTGEWSTSKDSIEHLRFEHEAMEMLFEWREWRHIGDSFCRPILELIPESEDVYFVKGKLKNTRTATRRLAYEDPNLLNIPVRTEMGKRVRECYIAPEGWVLGAMDLSQIEARCLAHESNDPLLVQLFNEGKDIHIETAARIFEIPVGRVTKEERTPTKTINYGIIYGQQGPGLATELRKLGLKGWPNERCQETINKWYEIYSGVKRYGNQLAKEVAETGEVRDHWGMPRYLPGIWSKDWWEFEEAKRLAVSHRVQGLAQGMIQESMIWLTPRIWAMQDEGKEVYPLLQLHDELIFLLREDLWGELRALVEEGLTKHCGIQLRVPVLAEGTYGKSWGELK